MHITGECFRTTRFRTRSIMLRHNRLLCFVLCWEGFSLLYNTFLKHSNGAVHRAQRCYCPLRGVHDLFEISFKSKFFPISEATWISWLKYMKGGWPEVSSCVYYFFDREVEMWKFRHFVKIHFFSESKQSATMLGMTACIPGDEKTHLRSWRVNPRRAQIHFPSGVKL